MKKVLLLLAVVLAFTFTAMAQTQSTGGDTGQATTTTKAKKSKKGSAAGESSQAAGGGAAKETTMTGCLSAQPDKNGNYTLSNAQHKKGVEVGPADTLKEHAGHQIELTGTWSAGEKGKKKMFQTSNVKHIADTCEKAPGGATTSEKPAGKTAEGKPKKGAKSGGGGNPPPQM